MKILKNNDIAIVDKKTIEYEPISSLDLMERSAKNCFAELTKIIPKNTTISIFAGSGNNGGDALAIARMLIEYKYHCNVFLYKNDRQSDNCKINQERLEQIIKANELGSITIYNEEYCPEIKIGKYVIDGLFGAGLSRLINGRNKNVIEQINQSNAFVISIDIPSGLFGEINNQDNQTIVKSDITLCLNAPKISVLLPENEQFVGKIKIIDIALHAKAIDEIDSNWYFTEQKDIVLKKRLIHSHKGTFGHGLLIAGSKGMIGATQLSAKACLRSGIGLLTIYTSRCGYNILQTAIPEAMTQTCENDNYINSLPNTTKYSAIAIGPGLGQNIETCIPIKQLLESAQCPLIIDADGLNIIANNKLIDKIPKDTIITPHPKEFERLFGHTTESTDRLALQSAMAKKYGIIIVLKGHFTSIALPNGELHFNSTGNQGMATAGSGDTLTGIILSLLAQGYSSRQAAIYGVYIHGLAGDFAAQQIGFDSLIASDIINNLPQAFKTIRQ